jgi:hypothetical protein
MLAPSDKLVHLAYFFVFAVLLSIADAGRRLFPVVADEPNQTFMAERVASLGDFFAGCPGAAGGAAAGRRLIGLGAGAR